MIDSLLNHTNHPVCVFLETSTNASLVEIPLHTPALDRRLTHNPLTVTQQTVWPLWHTGTVDWLPPFALPIVNVHLFPRMFGRHSRSFETHKNIITIPLSSTGMAIHSGQRDKRCLHGRFRGNMVPCSYGH